MQKYEAIENGIANNDIRALREAIGSICYTCRDFSNGEFDAVIQEVESKGIKIKDEKIVGRATISSQKNNFTDEDFAKAIFELKKNFCDERIVDVKTIGKKLYGNKPISNHAQEPYKQKSTYNNSTGTSPNHNSHPRKKNIVPAVVAGIAVIAIVLTIVYQLNK